MTLSKILDEYVEIRFQSGFTLKNTKRFLKKFINYMKTKKARHITVMLSLNFATHSNNCTLYECARKLGMIRQFAIYVKMFDPKTEVPPKDLLPFTYHRRTPYTYTKNEIIDLLHCCRRLPSRYFLYSLTHYTLFGLIAVTGMRTGETIALDCESVDLELGIITIYESKFKKSRMIPIHSSTIKVLKEYAKRRDNYFKKRLSPYFFVNNFGKGLHSSSVQQVFRQVSIKIGLRKEGKSEGPRILDLRHTFAVNTLIRCYQEGLDVEVVIPTLSTYLGHANPVHTYWYLTATPELLKIVNRRVEEKFGGQ